MHLKFLLLSIGGVLQVLTCIQAVPIEAIYTGDSCDCPKKLNYFVNMPQPPMIEDYGPSEYGYKLDWPLPGKAKVTYSFDFGVEEPKTLPPPDVKLDLYANIDRIMAHKKDCSASSRYVSPESSAVRYTRNLKHPNAIDDMTPLSSHIMAIFLEPLKQTKLDISKSRNKRDLARIFTRPRKNEKRSDRLVKQYSKRLTDLTNEKTVFDDTQTPTSFRTSSSGIRPLQQLSNFLNLANLRSKRDIKGEYDLIEKEREQMDLTLPDIIQYMPETLDPNFKRNQCHFGQSCQHNDLSESTNRIISSTLASKTSTTMPTKRIGTVQNANNNIKDKDEQKKMVNSINLPPHTKRNTAGGYSDGCPSASNIHNPTPNPNFTYEPLTSFEAKPRPFSTVENPHGYDPVPQQYVGASQSPSASAIFDNTIVEAASRKPRLQPISNSQLDQIIAEIVRKHSDFIQASSHHNGALVDPPKIQNKQTKYFLKSLKAAPWNNWFGEYYPRQH